MQFLRFPLVKVFPFFLAGIVLSHSCEINIKYLEGATLLIIAALLVLHRFRITGIFEVAACLASMAVGIATEAVHRETNYTHHFTKLASHEVASIYKIVIREQLKNGMSGPRYVADIESFGKNHATGKILINAASDCKHFQIGNRLTVFGKLLHHKPVQNPGQFDYGKYLRNKSIYARLYIKPQDIIDSGETQKDIYHYSDRIRSRILENIRKSGMPARELNVIAALILGQQQEIASDITDDYRMAGAVHVLSVSGLHVGFIILMIEFCMKPFPNTRKWGFFKVLITILALWAFAFIAGLSPSVVRSAAMFSLIAYGNYIRRSSNTYHTLVASAFLILLVEPMFIYDVGFQLSYAALFFIVWLQPWLMSFLKPENKILRYFWTILTVSVAAQMGTFPLSVYYFHQFPGLFFITNLIIIPFLTVIMILGVGSVAIAAFTILPKLFSISLGWSVSVMNQIIAKVASFEDFVIEGIPMDGIMMTLLYLCLIFVVLAFQKKSALLHFAAWTSIIICQSYYIHKKFAENTKDEFIVFQNRRDFTVSIRNGSQVTAYAKTDEVPRCINDYLIFNHCKLERLSGPKRIMSFQNKKIVVVDTAAMPAIKSDILIMRNSPKINLDRWLEMHRPEVVVADGSNYRTYAQRWKQTCIKRKIPFHHTDEKGSYILH